MKILRVESTSHFCLANVYNQHGRKLFFNTPKREFRSGWSSEHLRSVCIAPGYKMSPIVWEQPDSYQQPNQRCPPKSNIKHPIGVFCLSLPVFENAATLNYFSPQYVFVFCMTLQGITVASASGFLIILTRDSSVICQRYVKIIALKWCGRSHILA